MIVPIRIEGIIADKNTKPTKEGELYGILKIQYPINSDFNREADITALVGHTLEITLDDPQGDLYRQTLRRQRSRQQNFDLETENPSDEVPLPQPPDEDEAEIDTHDFQVENSESI